MKFERVLVGAMGRGRIRIVHRETGALIAEYLINGIAVFDQMYKEKDIVLVVSGHVDPTWTFVVKDNDQEEVVYGVPSR